MLFIDRQKFAERYMSNSGDMRKLFESYNIPYTYLVDFRGSFAQQVKLYNDHGILVGMHGAGFLNEMFMRLGSAVIEIFPYHLKHKVYRGEANIAGLQHFGVYVQDMSSNHFRHMNSHTAMDAYLEKNCPTTSSVRANMVSECRGLLLTAKNITVPMRRMEQTLIDALDWLGYRTTYKGIFKDYPELENTGPELEQERIIASAAFFHKQEEDLRDKKISYENRTVLLPPYF